jgi:hypothetical protein
MKSKPTGTELVNAVHDNPMQYKHIWIMTGNVTQHTTNNNSVALVCERTISTERPPLVLLSIGEYKLVIHLYYEAIHNEPVQLSQYSDKTVRWRTGKSGFNS